MRKLTHLWDNAKISWAVLENISEIQELIEKLKQDELSFKIDQSELESQKDRAKNNIEIIKRGLAV